VIVCQGGKFGGFSFYIKNGKPSFTYNFLGLAKYTVAASQVLKPVKRILTYDFKYDGGGLAKGGMGTISIDGAKAAEGRMIRQSLEYFQLMICPIKSGRFALFAIGFEATVSKFFIDHNYF